MQGDDASREKDDGTGGWGMGKWTIFSIDPRSELYSSSSGSGSVPLYFYRHSSSSSSSRRSSSSLFLCTATLSLSSTAVGRSAVQPLGSSSRNTLPSLSRGSFFFFFFPVSRGCCCCLAAQSSRLFFFFFLYVSTPLYPPPPPSPPPSSSSFSSFFILDGRVKGQTTTTTTTTTKERCGGVSLLLFILHYTLDRMWRQLKETRGEGIEFSFIRGWLLRALYINIFFFFVFFFFSCGRRRIEAKGPCYSLSLPYFLYVERRARFFFLSSFKIKEAKQSKAQSRERAEKENVFFFKD